MGQLQYTLLVFMHGADISDCYECRLENDESCNGGRRWDPLRLDLSVKKWSSPSPFIAFCAYFPALQSSKKFKITTSSLMTFSLGGDGSIRSLSIICPAHRFYLWEVDMTLEDWRLQFYAYDNKDLLQWWAWYLNWIKFTLNILSILNHYYELVN